MNEGPDSLVIFLRACDSQLRVRQAVKVGRGAVRDDICPGSPEFVPPEHHTDEGSLRDTGARKPTDCSPSGGRPLGG